MYYIIILNYRIIRLQEITFYPSDLEKIECPKKKKKYRKLDHLIERSKKKKKSFNTHLKQKRMFNRIDICYNFISK